MPGQKMSNSVEPQLRFLCRVVDETNMMLGGLFLVPQAPLQKQVACYVKFLELDVSLLLLKLVPLRYLKLVPSLVLRILPLLSLLLLSAIPHFLKWLLRRYLILQRNFLWTLRMSSQWIQLVLVFLLSTSVISLICSERELHYYS
jgi:hypothetical protein